MKRLNNKEFIQRVKQVHGDKYDYSKVEYKNNKTKICIICPKHGEFWQTPTRHLSGDGCPSCSGVKRLSTEEFIEKAREIHGEKYNYDKVEIVGNNKTKICIICPKHGEFWQTPNAHLSKKQGCPLCKSMGHIYSTDEWVNKAKEIHKDKYDYSKVEYNNSLEKVCIICPKHGEFWQTPASHLNGRGCPKCRESHLEADISTFLSKNGILFEREKRFDWLGLQTLDFYLPDYNVAIECQGGQHFKPVKRFGGEKVFKDILERDEKKLKNCENNGIIIFYYSDFKIEYPYRVFTDKKIMLNEIIYGKN